MTFIPQVGEGPSRCWELSCPDPAATMLVAAAVDTRADAVVAAERWLQVIVFSHSSRSSRLSPLAFLLSPLSPLPVPPSSLMATLPTADRHDLDIITVLSRLVWMWVQSWQDSLASEQSVLPPSHRRLPSSNCSPRALTRPNAIILVLKPPLCALLWSLVSRLSFLIPISPVSSLSHCLFFLSSRLSSLSFYLFSVV